MLPLSKKRKPVYRNFATKYFFGWRQMRIALIINIHASALMTGCRMYEVFSWQKQPQQRPACGISLGKMALNRRNTGKFETRRRPSVQCSGPVSGHPQIQAQAGQGPGIHRQIPHFFLQGLANGGRSGPAPAMITS
jgi:hypothetical protein